MAKNLKRLCALVMALVMCGSTLSIGVSAAETPENPTPAVTVQLVPGKDETSSSAKVDLENVTVTRDVKATTSDIIVTTKQTPGELTAVQSALKFDRNNTADQKAQKVARELYTDNGHFHDPSTFTVTDAPEGYPFKYVGHGDYSGHYVSHIKVIYERDAAGNAIKDANGNYVIKELQHAGTGTPLYHGGKLATNPDGPFHYATGTRPQQFLLMDEFGKTFYGYCIDLATGAEGNTWYALANLEDNDYYATQESEDHVRGIVFNGYWGTESGTGSLASLKEALKAAVAAGSVEDEYNIKMVNRKKFTTGYELAEGEYHYGSYVYWDIPPVDVTLTADIIDQMTEGEALDAMQAAIWSWANGSQATLNGVDGVIVGDLSASSSTMSDSLNGKNDPEGAARTRALYAWLMSQKVSADDAKTVIVNDKTFVEDMSLTIGKQLTADAFEAKLSFSNSFTVDQDKDNLKIVLTYVDADGYTQNIEKSLTGEGALVAENGYYTIDGLKLSKAKPFQFTLNIVGEQYLTKNAYIFTSENGTKGSQTMVSLAEGTISVDVSKTVDVTFDVENKFTPVTPPKHETVTPDPSADKTDVLVDRLTNRFEVEIAVPGEDGDKRHDEVILMVDGSYSMDNEWPAMKEAIITIGETVLNGSGNTQLTLMAFGMGDNEVLVHVKDVADLEASLGALPGNLLYGRSSTNCEAGFTGVAEYIANHDESLNEVNVIFISDGNLNTDETPRDFYFNWKTWTKFGDLFVAQAAFEETLTYGENLPAAFTAVFGDRFNGATHEEIIERGFGGEVTDAEFLAFADQLWADVYAYSGLIPGIEYPVSDAERAFVKYDKDNGTYIQDLFYYTTYKSAYVTYGNCWTRTPAAADKLAAMDEVAAMYVVDYDGYTAWMDTGITSEKSTFIQSNGIAGLCEALAGALTDLAKTPFNDVYVTDYMSKWVNLDASTLKIVDNSTGETIWTVAGGWLIDNAPTAKNPPVVVEKIASADYANGGVDVIGNTSGDIYKLTWYVKDGAMLRSDTYSLKYEVTVDTAEKGFEYNKEYPANGNTDLHYTDENGKDKTKEIEVPPVDGVKDTVDEIVIHKVDTNGNALNGAKFALYSGDTLIGEYAVEGGKVSFKNLKPGTYKLVETVAPNGYIGVSEPMYFEIIADEDGNFEIKHVFEEFEVNFPATAYEISNHSMFPAIPQTFVLLEGDKADTWSYPGEYTFGESNYRVVYCGDSKTDLEDGTRYVKTTLEDCFNAATANHLRAIVANSYPYATAEEVRAAAAAAGVADAENLTRGDMIAATQLAIWKYTNGENYTYRATYSVKDYPRWGKVYHDYSNELPENLQTLTGTTNTVQDEASKARIDALYGYLMGLAPKSAAYSDVDVFFYTANGGKDVSQSLIGGDKPSFYVNGLDIFVKNVKVTVETPEIPEKPETSVTVSFNNGDASNISFMLLDPATGEVEFVKKYDIGSETSYEIPTEEGKISCVFVKQSTSGMFWFAQEVSEDMQQAVIDCLKANNPSYKGHNAIAFGEGDHELEFKKGKFVTYTFAGDIADVEVKEDVKDEVIENTETTEPETTAPSEPETTAPSEPETSAPSEPVVPEVEETKPEAPKAEEPKGELTVKVEGGKVTNWTVIDGVTGIYIEANGKIPAVIWTSVKVDDAALAAFIEALGADADAEVIYDFGSHDITYNHNKNKTKTVTFTFTNLAQEEPAPAAEVAETEASEPVVEETQASEPVVEETKPEATETEPEVEGTKASEPVVEETQPEATETEPEVEETKGNGKNKNKKNK